MIAVLEENVTTISKEDAIAKLKAYRQAVHSDAQRTDKLMRRVLRNVTKYNATRLIDLSEVLPRGGVDEKGRPKLAVARADWEKVKVERTWNPVALTFCKWVKGWHESSHAAVNVTRLPLALFPQSQHMTDSSALVPTIPVEKRPVDALSNYWILWEAIWTDEPPRDPYLLRRIEDTLLFAIVEQWDLSPLERMVMRASQHN